MTESKKLQYSQEHLRDVVGRGIGAGAILLDDQSKPTDPTNTLFLEKNPLDFKGKVATKVYVMDGPRQILLFALCIRDGQQPEESNIIFDRALMALARNVLPPEALKDHDALKEYILTKYPNLKGSL